MNVLYTTSATSTGGRDGQSTTGSLQLTLNTPKELGGSGGPGTNPEQLFAAGYSACFLNAIKFVAAKSKIKIPDTSYAKAEVSLGMIDEGFGLEVTLTINLPGLTFKTADQLVKTAHQVCPYSNATRNNIHVSLNVTTD